jgi:hypothetical protein
MVTSAVSCVTNPFDTSAEIFSAVAWGTGFWPTTAAGAISQRPTHGAWSTRTSVPSSFGSDSSNACEPARVAGDGIADTDRQRGRDGVAFFHHIEVVIEGRHLVDLGHRHLHLISESHEVRR